MKTDDFDIFNFEESGLSESGNNGIELPGNVFSSELENAGIVDDEIIDLDEQIFSLACLCPSCGERNEIEQYLQNETNVIVCSNCSKKLHFILENCSCRAKRKSHGICCANCGATLDHHAHCITCGKLYPDYYVAVNPEDVRRKAAGELFRKAKESFNNFSFSLKSHSTSESHESHSHTYVPVSSTQHKTASSSMLMRKLLIYASILIVLLLVVGGGTYAYNTYKTEKAYAENYFKSLYCIKTGIDSNITISTAMKKEWESAIASGGRYTPVISSDVDAKNLKLKGEIDKYMGTTVSPPAKFSLANDKLTAIHKVYLESTALTANRPASLQELSVSIDKVSRKVTPALQDLKQALPDMLIQELATAKLKYRGLKDI